MEEINKNQNEGNKIYEDSPIGVKGDEDLKEEVREEVSYALEKIPFYMNSLQKDFVEIEKIRGDNFFVKKNETGDNYLGISANFFSVVDGVSFFKLTAHLEEKPEKSNRENFYVSQTYRISNDKILNKYFNNETFESEDKENELLIRTTIKTEAILDFEKLQIEGTENKYRAHQKWQLYDDDNFDPNINRLVNLNSFGKKVYWLSTSKKFHTNQNCPRISNSNHELKSGSVKYAGEKKGLKTLCQTCKIMNSVNSSNYNNNDIIDNFDYFDLNDPIIHDVKFRFYYYNSNQSGLSVKGYLNVPVKIITKITTQKFKYNTSSQLDRENINAYLRQSFFNPKTVLLNDSLFYSKEKEEEFYITDSDVYILTRNNTKQKENEQFTIKNNSTNIFPGAILYANKELTEGTPKLFSTELERNPVKLTFSVENNCDEETVSEVYPNHSDIKNAIDKFTKNLNFKSIQSANFNHHYHNSKKSLMYELKCNVDILNKAKISFDVNSSSEETKFYEALTFEEELFTVSIDHDYENIFKNGKKSDGSNPEEVAKAYMKFKELNKNNEPLVLITSATYGRFISLLKEYTINFNKLSSSQNLKFKSIDLNSNQELTKNIKDFKTRWIALGASKETINGLLNISCDTEESVAKKFNESLKLLENSYFSKPLKYTMVLISGNEYGTEISPTFTVNDYSTSFKRAINKFKIEINNNVSSSKLERYKVQVYYKTFCLMPIGNNEYRKVDGSRYMFEKVFNSQKKVSKKITLQENEYLDGDIQITIRGKDNVAASYKDYETQFFDISSGNLYLEVSGNLPAVCFLNKPYIHSNTHTD